MTYHPVRSLRALLIGALTFGTMAQGFAAPFAVAPPETGMSVSHIEEVRYRGRRGGNGFPAAALGIFALGTAAIIAGNRQNRYDCGYYDGGCGNYSGGYYGDQGYGQGFYSGGYYGRGAYGGRYYGNQTYYGRGYGGRSYYGRRNWNSNGINGGGR